MNLARTIMNRILVTGGAGFLGSHLCDRLIADGADVLCVDNFYTGNKANIAPLMANPYFEVMRHDVTFPLYAEVDQIFNLACPASPVHYQFDPVQTDRKSTRLNSSHTVISYAVFCLKKKKNLTRYVMS